MLLYCDGCVVPLACAGRDILVRDDRVKCCPVICYHHINKGEYIRFVKGVTPEVMDMRCMTKEHSKMVKRRYNVGVRYIMCLL